MGLRVAKYKSFNKIKWIKMFDKFYMRYIIGKNSTFLQCKFEKGCVIPQHTHQKNEEILHINKGSLACYIGARKKKYLLKDGETIVIPPKHLHGWLALKNTITYEVFSPPRTRKQMDKLVKFFRLKQKTDRL